MASPGSTRRWPGKEKEEQAEEKDWIAFHNVSHL